MIVCPVCGRDVGWYYQSMRAIGILFYCTVHIFSPVLSFSLDFLVCS